MARCRGLEGGTGLFCLALAACALRASFAQSSDAAQPEDQADQAEPKDTTLGGCFCRDVWSVADNTCRDGSAVYRGCGMSTPCDGADNGRGYTWCYIEDPRGCTPEDANWDWCLPGVRDYSSDPPPADPCDDKDFLAFQCPTRAAMAIGVLVVLCGCAIACSVVSLRRHLQRRRAGSKYGADTIEHIRAGEAAEQGSDGRPLADTEPTDQVKPSPGLELLGRGVRLEIAPHLAATAAALSPSEVIPCGGLTQVSVQTLGQVVAPAVLGQDSDGVFRTQQNQGRRNRFFVPAGVAVDGVRMQSYLSLHADAGPGGENGRPGSLLSSITLSSKRGLDTRAAANAVARALAAMPGSASDSALQPRRNVTLQLHLERFRVRFKPSLPERGEEALSLEFLPCLAGHMAAAKMGPGSDVVTLSAPPSGHATGASANDAAAAGEGGAGTRVENLSTGDTEDDLLASSEPLVPNLDPAGGGSGESDLSQRYGEQFIEQVFCGGHIELQLSILPADGASAAGDEVAANDDAESHLDADESLVTGGCMQRSESMRVVCDVLAVNQSGGLPLERALQERTVNRQPEQLQLEHVLDLLSDWCASILRFKDPVPVRLGLSGWHSLLTGHTNIPSPTEPPNSRLPPLAVPPDSSMMLPSPGGDAPSALPATSSHIGSRINRSSSGSVSELPGPTPGTQQQQQAERPDSRSSSQGDLSNDSVYDSLGSDFAVPVLPQSADNLSHSV